MNGIFSVVGKIICLYGIWFIKNNSNVSSPYQDFMEHKQLWPGGTYINTCNVALVEM